MRNPETGMGKGFAFVRYVSADAAAVRSLGVACGFIERSGADAARRPRWST